MTAGTMRWWLSKLAVGVVVLGVANFLWFMADSSRLGGDALNGYAADGHYFVASHGTYTEVSEAAWTANRNHGIVMMLSWPVVILTAALHHYLLSFPSKLAGGAADDASERVAWVRSTGAAIWWGTLRADAGGFNPTVGYIDAALHPGGLVVKPKFASPSAILADEIESVQFGRRLMASTIEIDHAGRDVVSPLVLYGSASSPEARAIQWLASGPSGPPPPSIHRIAGWGVPRPEPTPPAAPRQSVQDRPALPARPSLPPRRSVEPLDVLELVAGLVVAVAGLVLVPWPFGIAWMAFATAILVANTMRLTRRRRW